MVFADFEDLRLHLKEVPFRQIDLNQADLADYGRHDLVMCSNVLEHLARAEPSSAPSDQLLNPGGVFYLSWTNWLSPWGGHEFSPWHYLGKRSGPIHTVGKIFSRPTSAKSCTFCARKKSQGSAHGPRYYNEFAFLMHIPVARESSRGTAALQVEKVDGD